MVQIVPCWNRTELPLVGDLVCRPGPAVQPKLAVPSLIVPGGPAQAPARVGRRFGGEPLLGRHRATPTNRATRKTAKTTSTQSSVRICVTPPFERPHKASSQRNGQGLGGGETLGGLNRPLSVPFRETE